VATQHFKNLYTQEDEEDVVACTQEMLENIACILNQKENDVLNRDILKEEIN
jgi:hypothetical protein